MATGKGRGLDWTGEAHKALAVALARVHGTFNPDQQAAVVKDMKDNGFDTTWEAVRQHLQKLKKKNGAEAANGAASSPNKPGRPAACRVKSPGAARNKRKMIRNLDDRLDEDDEKIELKRTKVEDDPLVFDQYTKREPGLDDDGTV